VTSLIHIHTALYDAPYVYCVYIRTYIRSKLMMCVAYTDMHSVNSYHLLFCTQASQNTVQSSVFILVLLNEQFRNITYLDNIKMLIVFLDDIPLFYRMERQQ
jgi:hypothetical protein